MADYGNRQLRGKSGSYLLSMKQILSFESAAPTAKRRKMSRYFSKWRYDKNWGTVSWLDCVVEGRSKAMMTCSVCTKYIAKAAGETSMKNGQLELNHSLNSTHASVDWKRNMEWTRDQPTCISMMLFEKHSFILLLKLREKNKSAICRAIFFFFCHCYWMIQLTKGLCDKERNCQGFWYHIKRKFIPGFLSPTLSGHRM